ncbi:MAG: GFA family protein [Alphaproteobacteria bacterium]|nr:GFA family protein [Alphaproteobacteria bacterium]
MIEASCHCGAVRMEIEAAPAELLDCRCSICRRLGALWSYYAPRQVRITSPEGATFIYKWQDEVLEFHTCRTCGCTTHWAPVDKSHDRMGVNARMMAPEIVAAAKLRVSPGPG